MYCYVIFSETFLFFSKRYNICLGRGKYTSADGLCKIVWNRIKDSGLYRGNIKNGSVLRKKFFWMELSEYIFK